MRLALDSAKPTIDRALAALPMRVPDAVLAERLRLRARFLLRTPRRSPIARSIGHLWYRAEPFAVGATVLLFLVWTLQRVSILVQ